jgi:hypothetical protein
MTATYQESATQEASFGYGCKVHSLARLSESSRLGRLSRAHMDAIVVMMLGVAHAETRYMYDASEKIVEFVSPELSDDDWSAGPVTKYTTAQLMQIIDANPLPDAFYDDQSDFSEDFED